MRRVFISCLGIGTKKGEGRFEYDPARYYLTEGEPSTLTPFVQTAELQLLGAGSFDKVVIVTTEKARGLHFTQLEREIRALGLRTDLICAVVAEDMSSKGQWAWFETILEQIQPGDHLTVDLTHGYRAIPIIFSTAIHFLQRSRGVFLEHVFYGAYDKNRDMSPIIDMKDFYIINEWAEGVSRLIEDADARKIADMVAGAPAFQLEDLKDDALAKAATDLTDRVRNVDMHNVTKSAQSLIKLVAGKKPVNSMVASLLLQLIAEKYGTLTTSDEVSGRYDRWYFAGQLAYIKLLLEHKLHMQAFTVMREVIGSIGLIAVENARTDTANGRRQRSKADIFINMLQFEEEKWQFTEDQQRMKNDLLPFYGRLKECGIEMLLRSFLKELLAYRNGFDHGWTKKPQAATDLFAQGQRFYQGLSEAVFNLEVCGILPN